MESLLRFFLFASHWPIVVCGEANPHCPKILPNLDWSLAVKPLDGGCYHLLYAWYCVDGLARWTAGRTSMIHMTREGAKGGSLRRPLLSSLSLVNVTEVSCAPVQWKRDWRFELGMQQCSCQVNESKIFSAHLCKRVIDWTNRSLLFSIQVQATVLAALVQKLAGRR